MASFRGAVIHRPTRCASPRDTSPIVEGGGCPFALSLLHRLLKYCIQPCSNCLGTVLRMDITNRKHAPTHWHGALRSMRRKITLSPALLATSTAMVTI